MKTAQDHRIDAIVDVAKDVGVSPLFIDDLAQSDARVGVLVEHAVELSMEAERDREETDRLRRRRLAVRLMALGYLQPGNA